MKVLEYLKSLARSGSRDSSRSFALVLSSMIGALVGLCVCFCLVWDVCANGYLETDLDGLGVFLLCTGGFIAGGGLNKALSGRGKGLTQTTKEEEKKNESKQRLS